MLEGNYNHDYFKRSMVMAIQQTYDDNLKHIHVLSYGGGTQSTALLLMALNGEINGVIPDFIIFSDTGWENQRTYDWVEKVNEYIKKKYNREIIITQNGNLREDLLQAAVSGERVASIPFFTKDGQGQKGLVRRQCTKEYKIIPVTKEIRKQLGYQPRTRVKEMVHLWKGISTDEIQRAKPLPDRWITAEHPLIDIMDVDRSGCISYVENTGLGTPEQSSCVGCPYHSNAFWKEMKTKHPGDWADAIEVDNAIRSMSRFKTTLYLHRSCVPLEDIEFGGDQTTIDDFINECEGMCGN